MVVTRERRWGRRIKLAAIIVGGIVAIFAVASFITQIVDVEDQIIEISGLTLISLHVDSLFIYLSAVFVVIGYILSWWHKLTAGILLVLAGIFLIGIDFLPDSFLAPNPEATIQTVAEAAQEPAFIFAIPPIIAGALFIWYWSLSRKNT
jgi:hypothetical protein